MKPDINRVVRYVIGLDSWGKPVVRPAMIVQTWEGTCVNLQVFTDGENDARHCDDATKGIVWRGSVVEEAEGKTVNTWHWPPLAPSPTQASPDEKSKGQIGYEAYAQHTGGKTFDGRDMPTWEQVKASGTKVAGAWEAAAHAIVKSCIGSGRGTKLIDAPVIEKTGGVKECG